MLEGITGYNATLVSTGNTSPFSQDGMLSPSYDWLIDDSDSVDDPQDEEEEFEDWLGQDEEFEDWLGQDDLLADASLELS